MTLTLELTTEIMNMELFQIKYNFKFLFQHYLYVETLSICVKMRYFHSQMKNAIVSFYLKEFFFYFNNIFNLEK